MSCASHMLWFGILWTGTISWLLLVQMMYMYWYIILILNVKSLNKIKALLMQSAGVVTLPFYKRECALHSIKSFCQAKKSVKHMQQVLTLHNIILLLHRVVGLHIAMHERLAYVLWIGLYSWYFVHTAGYFWTHPTDMWGKQLFCLHIYSAYAVCGKPCDYSFVLCDMTWSCIFGTLLVWETFTAKCQLSGYFSQPIAQPLP